jgi:hypothetical protein
VEPLIISFRFKYQNLDGENLKFLHDNSFLNFLIREQQQIFKNLDEKDGKIDRKISRKDLTDWVQQQSAPSLLSLDTEERKLSRYTHSIKDIVQPKKMGGQEGYHLIYIDWVQIAMFFRYT